MLATLIIAFNVPAHLYQPRATGENSVQMEGACSSRLSVPVLEVVA